MIRRATLLALSCLTWHPVVVHSDDGSRQRWWRDEGRDAHWARPCEVKVESKRGEFKREVKCKDGVGATWRGEWKEEFMDGPCKVKLEASREEFKEEVKCEGRH